MNAVTLVLNYKKTNANALNVIVGALDTAPDLADVPVIFARDHQTLIEKAAFAHREGRTVLVAWSFYSPQFRETFAELAELKRKLPPEILHIAGGVHATAEPEHVLRNGFDLAAVGEGERILIDLLRALKSGAGPASVRGIATLRPLTPDPSPTRGEERLVLNGQGERVDLDAFPANASRHHKFNPIEITRGCIYACKFCQTPFMFKARFRHRSVANVCETVRGMLDLKYRDIRFITPTSLSYGSQDESVNLPKVEELLSGIRDVLKTRGRIFFGTFPSEVRPEHVTPEALRMLKRYVDNDNLIIGGQSGSQRVLDESRRGHSVADIVNSVRICLEEGFTPNVDFIFGLPGETPDDALASIKLAEELSAMGARVHAHTFMPLPGTPFKNAGAAMLPPAIVQRLQYLSSHGRVYGQWKAQQEIAGALASRRTS